MTTIIQLIVNFDQNWAKLKRLSKTKLNWVKSESNWAELQCELNQVKIV